MTKATLEIFSQGEEIVSGQTVDTNAAWIARECVQLGFSVTRHTAVGDNLDALIQLLKDISSRADCCICSGGLGPTVDDLTAKAVEQAFTLPLQYDPLAFEQIAKFFAARKREMPDSNRKQAFLPTSAQRIDNDWGTAPGFALKAQRCWFVFLPGVPYEMKSMFQASVRPLLKSRFSLRSGKLITIKTVGIGESDLQTLIDSVTFPDPVQLGFRADSEHVETKLLFPPDYPVVSMQGYIQQCTDLIGPYVFKVDGFNDNRGDLINVIDELMRESQHKAVFIETISQGLMAAKCFGCDWLVASHYARMSSVQSSDDRESAKQLAMDARQEHGAEIVLVQYCEMASEAITDNLKMITVYNTLLTPDGFHVSKHDIAGSAMRKQNQAAILGLDFIRRFLQHLN